jgi:hypothetical protein
MLPYFGPFTQIAYITNDMERAKSVMADRFGIPGWFDILFDRPAVYCGEPAAMRAKIALARTAGVEIELIEDIGSEFDLYRQGLPDKDEFALTFHHFCRTIVDRSAWDAMVAELDRPIMLTADVGSDGAFIYTDERALVGHYVEHCWFSPEKVAVRAQQIPYFPV